MLSLKPKNQKESDVCNEMDKWNKFVAVGGSKSKTMN